MIISFLLLEKILDTGNLKEELFNLAVISEIYGQLAPRQKYHGRGHGRAKLLNSQQPGSKPKEKPERKEPDIVPKACLQDPPRHTHECASS